MEREIGKKEKKRKGEEVKKRMDDDVMDWVEHGCRRHSFSSVFGCEPRLFRGGDAYVRRESAARVTKLTK